MAKVTNFEHNGVSLNATESPEAMGGIGDNVIGIVGTAPNAAMAVPKNSPFRISGMLEAEQLDPTGAESGTLYQVVKQILKVVKVPIYVVVVEAGATPAATLANVIGGVDATSGQRKGLAALTVCQEVPTIIGAPGFSHEQAVHSELASIGKRIRARVVLDGKDVTVADQVTNSGAIGGADLGYDRCYLVHQMPAVYSKAAQANVFLAPSSLAIAALASVKQWESPGNQVTYAADVSRTVEYNILDKSTEGDLLNSYGVSYYARTDLGGFSLIGNRTITGKFISYVGLEDAIARKLVGSAQKAMAKNLTKSFMDQEVERVNSWLQTLVADGTIPGGKVYLHPELNSVEKYKNGTWYLCIDYGRYAPNEHMVYQLNASDAIVEEFLEDVL
ncbi:phage tail protein [Pseudomonas asiatica]|uniref:phage tail protein n=1 Tax=Pseudomonas asiatica TaxID=2219225 RepID=UPI0025AA4EBB|nr:phage tail protein [Pseudomonas asiatica]MDM9557376.1 phage tail protein [Pseudomonas asiatica]